MAEEATVEETVVEEPVVQSDPLPAGLHEHVVAEEATSRRPWSKSRWTQPRPHRHLHEHVVAEEATVEETVVEEPVLGWLPTWTTEIKLVDAGPELGDEPDATDPDSDDLSLRSSPRSYRSMSSTTLKRSTIRRRRPRQ